MKKILIAMCVALSLAACDDSQKSDKPIIKIGVSLPLSGDLGYVGEPVKKSIELALRDISEQQNLKYDYKLIFEDDQLSPKKIVTNYSKFKSVDKVSAVMTIWSNANAISPRTEADKIINFGCAWGKTYANGEYNFNNSIFSDEQDPMIIAEMKKHGVKKIGILYNQTAGDEELVAALIPSLKKSNFEIVFVRQFKMDQKDYKQDIASLKKIPVDVVFTTLITPGLEIFHKQALEAGYTPEYTGYDIMTYAPQYFEGTYYLTDALATPKFLEHLKNNGIAAATSCVVNTYDSLRMIVRGFEETAPMDGAVIPVNEDVIKTIMNMRDFDSVALGGVRMDSDGNVHTMPVLSIIKNGKPEPLK
ncbi:hypothetical protein FACS18945_2300 [Bacteroidia bacterium]|nr:hypothetical protein FACS18945_2300 [Bacteroidia bacterium]